ncbi:MAG TPA: PAS domain S-box protein [Rhodopila sp.]|nr:PAS domain S-box protein [Rhodopila sp.]
MGPALPRLRFPVLLLGLVLAVLLPSLAIGVGAAYQSAAQRGTLAEGRLRENARALALSVGGSIEGLLQATATLADSPALDPGTDPAVTDDALRRASRVLGLPIAMTAPDGRIIVHTEMPRGAPLPHASHPAAYRRVLETGQPAIVDLYTGVISHALQAAAMVPVMRDGRARAVLAVRVEVDHLRRLLMAQPLRPGAFAGLVDASHRVVARSDSQHSARIGQALPAGNAAHLAAADAGLFRGPSMNGRPLVFAFHSVPSMPGWSVIVAERAADLDAAWRTPLLTLGVGGVLALALGAVLASLVGRQVIIPLRRLRDHAHALAAANGEPVGQGAAALPRAAVAELEALRRGFAAAEDALHRRSRTQQVVSDALLSSEARLRELLATVDMGAFMARELDDTIQHWSAGCERLYGWTAAEAIGRSSQALLGTRYPEPVATIGAKLERDGMWTGELWHRTRDGRGLIVIAHKVLRRDAAGHATVLEVLTDTTGQREAEARLRAVLEALPVGVVIADAQGGLVHCNAAHHRLWGVPPRTENWKDYANWVGYWPDTGERIKATEWAMTRALLTGETIQGEMVECEQFGTGERRIFINNAAPIRDPAGTIVGGVVAELDVTEARQAEASLAESEARLRTLIETVPVGLVLAEFPSGRIVSGNSYVETLLRHPVLHSPDFHSYDEWVSYHADGTRVQSHEYPLARMALNGEDNPTIEVHYQRGDGTRAWMRVLGRAIRDRRGRLIGGVIAIMDVDAERQSRDALARTTAELEQLVGERTRALRESESRLAQASKMEALGRLAGGVAHDFNNILQVVQGSADMAARRLRSDPKLAEPLMDMVVDAAARGMDVTGRLLAFARRSDLIAAPIAPAPLLDGLTRMLRHTLGPTVRLQVEVGPDVPPLMADRGQLETVLVNLANNARDALPADGGTITLSATAPDTLPEHLEPGRYVRLSVSDTGEGMTPEVLARVSEPFFTTKARGKGTGLGLAMARGFAEQSGGGLVIESTPGVGTTVSLWLPVAQGGRPTPDTGERVDAPPPTQHNAVLLVDDDPTVRAVLSAILDDQGHSVTEADSADVALRLLDAGIAADVLVTDLSMPGSMDGLGLVREARRRRAGMPAVLVTGHLTEAEDAAVAAAGRGGPFVVLRKPAPGRAIQAGIEAVLQGR